MLDVKELRMTTVDKQRSRVIVTTDGEVDDRSSFVRFLLYVNEWDIEGLIYTNSKWHPHGEGTTWIEERLDAYEQVRDTLLVHDAGYPTAQQLRETVAVGDLHHQGTHGIGPDRDTAGSERIVASLLSDDPRPVWIQAWGGTNTIAQALYRIRESHPGALEQAVRKVRLYAIAVQEREEHDSGPWIRAHFPGVTFIRNASQFWRSIAYAKDRRNPLADHEMYTEEWLTKHVKTGHGPLGPLYEMSYQSEGDSPAFFHLMPVGLRGTENPFWGGWGGRFARRECNFWMDAEDDGDEIKPQWRWLEPLANDFVARMDWCVAGEFADANHPPVVRLGHEENLAAEAGTTITVSAEGTTDPDGDTLTYRWWQYTSAGEGSVRLAIADPSRPATTVHIPECSKGTAHLIVEVTDDGTPPLTRYRRAVIHIDE